MLPKNYLNDKLILLLASANVFLAFLCAALMFLRLNLGQGSEGYIVAYRANLGVSAFSFGGVVELLGFAIFAAGIAAVSLFLSIRMYRIRRDLSVSVLSASILLLLLATIVSNALVVLH